MVDFPASLIGTTVGSYRILEMLAKYGVTLRP